MTWIGVSRALNGVYGSSSGGCTRSIGRARGACGRRLRNRQRSDYTAILDQDFEGEGVMTANRMSRREALALLGGAASIGGLAACSAPAPVQPTTVAPPKIATAPVATTEAARHGR